MLKHAARAALSQGSRVLTGIKRYLLGNVSSKVSEHGPCSVMTGRAD